MSLKIFLVNLFMFAVFGAINLYVGVNQKGFHLQKEYFDNIEKCYEVKNGQQVEITDIKVENQIFQIGFSYLALGAWLGHLFYELKLQGYILPSD